MLLSFIPGFKHSILVTLKTALDSKGKAETTASFFQDQLLDFTFQTLVLHVEVEKDCVDPETTAGKAQKLVGWRCCFAQARVPAALLRQRWSNDSYVYREQKKQTVHVKMEDGRKQCKKAQSAQAEGNTHPYKLQFVLVRLEVSSEAEE